MTWDPTENNVPLDSGMNLLNATYDLIVALMMKLLK